MSLKNNCIVYLSEKSKRAVFMDTFTSKKHHISYDAALKIKNGVADDDLVESVNSLLSDIPVANTNCASKKFLRELRFIVTNKCNFKCPYCFADQGSYGMTPCVMTKDVAKIIVDYYFNHYYTIRQISFFGGEPLLAIDVIEFICDYIRDFYPDRIPRYSMVTNGYCINETILSILKRHNIAVVISIDGDKTIHDMQRPLFNGKGTYDVVKNNLHKCIESLQCSIEATYTTNHINNNVTRSDLADFLNNEFGLSRILINDAVVDADNENRQLMPHNIGLEDSVQDFFDHNGERNNDFIFSWIKTFINGKYYDRFCEAGVYKATVDMTGNIYPCHMFTGEKNYICGNVTEQEEIKKIKLVDKNQEICSSCKYKLYCFGCIHSMLSGHSICESLKKSVDRFLYKMLDLYIDQRDEYNEIIGRCLAYGRSNGLKQTI